MINFNKMPCIYWSDVTKASYLQRRIIVHSILYYQMSESVVSDSYFNALCKQLVQLQSSMKESEYAKTTYYYCFEEFDGSTGFHLYDALDEDDQEYLTELASMVLVSYKKNKGGGKR